MSTENQPPDDRELTGFLVGTSPASRTYRKLDRPESPPDLDQAILRMAQEELAKPAPATARLPRAAARWRVPLALAATLVLSLSTVLLIREDHGASRKALLEADAPPAAPAAVADMPAAAPLQQPPVSSASIGARSALPPVPAKPTPEAKAEASSEPKAKVAEQARLAASQRQDEASRRKEAEPVMRGNLAPAPAAKDAGVVDLLDKRAAPMEAQKPDAGFARKQMQEQERVYPSRTPPVIEIAPAPEASAGAAAGQMQAAPAAAFAPAPAPAPAPQRDEFRQKSSFSSAYADSVYAAPEQWLPRIRDLRDHGLTEEASRQLRAFIGIYPEYLLPDDLRPLLN